MVKIGTEVILPTRENIAKMGEGTLRTKEGADVAGFSPTAASAKELAEAGEAAERARLQLVNLSAPATTC